jgi:quinol monooxygenase YgiN
MTETLRVVAHIKAKPGKEDELKRLLCGLIEPTHKEAGCLEYRLYNNKADARDFTFIEEWESDAALDAHLATPHLENALSKMPVLLEGEPDIRRYLLIA